jgi:hypothetical protein
VNRRQGDRDATKIAGNTNHTEENPCLSEKKIAQTVSLHHDIMKRLMTEKLNLRRVTSNGFFTSSPPVKAVKSQDFAETFGAAQQLQVRDLVPVITGNKTWVCFESPRSAM